MLHWLPFALHGMFHYFFSSIFFKYSSNALLIIFVIEISDAVLYSLSLSERDCSIRVE